MAAEPLTRLAVIRQLANKLLFKLANPPNTSDACVGLYKQLHKTFEKAFSTDDSLIAFIAVGIMRHWKKKVTVGAGGEGDEIVSYYFDEEEAEQRVKANQDEMYAELKSKGFIVDQEAALAVQKQMDMKWIYKYFAAMCDYYTC